MRSYSSEIALKGTFAANVRYLVFIITDTSFLFRFQSKILHEKTNFLSYDFVTTGILSQNADEITNTTTI